ncbi:MAG: hypothetical protein AB1757_00750 [Acidobacteriota bacterium]
MQHIQEEKIFSMLEREMLLKRLAREFGNLSKEAQNLPAYLKAVFLPDRPELWLPRSFVQRVLDVFKHPIQFLKSAFSLDVINLGYIYKPADKVAAFTTDVALIDKPVKRRPLKKLLVLSTVVHSVAIIYLGYVLVMSIIAPYKNMRVVNKAYRQYDEKLVAVLPPRLKLPRQSLENTMSLDEIRERDRKRREEEERRRREEEERRRREEARKKAQEEKQAELAKAEQEAKDKAAAGEQAKTDDQKTDEKPKFGEINEAPIKEVLGQIYAMNKVGFINVDSTNLYLRLTFKIEKDGSISNIAVSKSSGNNYVDVQAKKVLFLLGESHALGPLHILSSCSIELTLTKEIAKLSIFAFAPSADEAKNQVALLNTLVWGIRNFGKNVSPDIKEVLGKLKASSSGNRVEANITISNDRAGELMKSKFDKPSGTP